MSDYVTKTNLLSALGRFKENTDNLYETKADANDLKNACEQRDSALDKRVTNLEQKAGDEIVVDYPSQTYGMDEVPANVAEYAKVSKLRGVTRAWNQLLQNPTGSITDWKTISSFNVDSSHKYLFHMVFSRASTGQGTDFQIFLEGANARHGIDGQMAYRDVVFSFANSGTTDVKCGYYTQYDSQNPVQYAIYVTDLNTYFNTSDLSFLGATDSAKLATIQTNYPWLLTPSDYGTSGVNTVYEGVRSKARNLWDEVYEEGDINYNTGVPQGNSNYIRSVNFCEVKANTSIYVKGNNTIWLLWYDANYGYLGGTNQDGTAGGTVVTSPANARYFKLVNRKIVFDGKICINVSDSQNGTYTPYKPPVTLTFPSPVSLKSAGAVADEVELNVEVEGVEKRRDTIVVGNKNFSDISFVYISSYDIYQGVLSGAKFTRGSSWGISNAPYANAGYVSSSDMIQGQYQVLNDGTIWIKDSNFENVKANYWLNYRLATPVVTLSDPVLDPFIQVEGGGTIRPTQSQTTKIDSSMTAEYLGV